jgi:hypothetical protein
VRSPSHQPDEFDAAARAGGPSGVHRAHRTWWSRWWPFVVVLVVFPALAYGAVTFLSDWEGLPGANETQSPPPQEPEGDVAEDEVTEPTEPEETVAPAPPPPAFDRAIEIFNATTTSGLASNARGRLEGAGFTAVTTGNWAGTDPPVSVVYYTSADDLGTAELVASTLGISTVQESAELAPESLIVVLVGDYTSV